MVDKENRDFFNRGYIETRRKISKLKEVLGCTFNYWHNVIKIYYNEKELKISPMEIYEKSIGEIVDMILGENR